MKKILIPFLVICIAILFNGCKGMKYYRHFQDIDTFDLSKTKGIGLHEVKIMPKDELQIYVSTFNPEASKPFNMEATASARGSNNGNNGNGGGGSDGSGYLVDNDGNINFPVIGRIHVAGLTKPQIEDLIQAKIAPYLNPNEHPVVKVRMTNFHVTLLGELGPAYMNVPNENMNIVDLLGASGDVGIHGKRYNVLLIRQDSLGGKHIHRYDLSKTAIFTDPYYWLQQNDIIYAEPTKQKTISASQGSWTNFWLSMAGWATSIATLIVTILN